MNGIICFCTCLFIGFSTALYQSNSDVVELTATNFQSKVVDSDSLWIVEFYAPWCGHCQSFAPEFSTAAKALKGIVKVGAVDMDQHSSVGGPYNVRGFPTIKIFGADKRSPADYNGARTAQGLADRAVEELKKIISLRIGGRTSGGSGGGRQAPPTGDKKDVIELTDSNFDAVISNSDDMWLVEFFAPWCGHCKNLEPHWQSAASQLKGKVKVAAVDATVNTVVANRFGIRGFPTIKMFPAGKKDMSDVIDYDGGRTADAIVEWAQNRLAENVPAPEVHQLISSDVLKESCEQHPICVVAFLPHILDCQSKCRNQFIQMEKDLADKFKKNLWGWLWVEGAVQPEVEDALGIGGFGYPAMAALNVKKMKFSILKGPFSYDGINDFLRELSFGKGSTAPLKGAALPHIVTTEPWDGKDGEYPKEEEIDLSDKSEL